MGLLDLFTGAASQRAAKNNMAAIATGQTQAINALGDAYGNAEGYLTNNALPALNAGYGQARQDLATAQAGTQNALGALQGLYQPLVDQGQGALTRYLNATGANGASGSAQAQQDFTAAPGYQYTLNQALGSVQRSAASRGGLAGGNATQDILNTATGLANQGYQQYITNLGNASSLYGQGVSGQAQGLTAQANANTAYGNGLAALGTGLGQGQANVYGSLGSLETARGQGAAGIIGNTTNALTQNNNNLAQSENAAGANILSGILGIGQLAAGGGGGLVGGVTGAARGGGNIFSGIGSGLKSLFS